MFKSKLVLAFALGLVVVAGCGKDKEEKPSADVPPTVEPPGPKPLVAADKADDSTYGPLFPASEKIQGWIKTEAVKAASGEKLDELLWDLAKVLRAFGPETILTAKYQRYCGTDTETVRAFVVKAPTTADAYGMLTVSCAGDDKIKIGDVYRVDGETIYVVRGQHFAVFKASTTGSDRKHLMDGAEILAGNTMFNLTGRGGPGELVQILQSAKLPPSQVFFVRDLESLTGSAGASVLEQTSLKQASKMTRLLDLGSDTEFALAAYKVNDWPKSNIMWLAKYPTDQDALKVYQNYKKLLRRAGPDSELHSNTMLKAPRSRYLLGCWSMEEESLNFLMPTIYSRLP